MKKILLLILLFACLITKAQFPNTVTGGNSSTLNKQLGAYGANLGYVWTAAYSDTTAANLSFIKNVPGIVIRIGNDLWMRSANILVWIKISGGGSGGYFNPNQTSTGNTLHDGNGYDFVHDSSSNIFYHLKRNGTSQFDIFASRGFSAFIGDISGSYYGYYDLWEDFNEFYLGINGGETMINQSPSSSGSSTLIWSKLGGQGSFLNVRDTDMYLDARNGKLKFGNLTNLSTQNRLIGQYGTSTQVGYTTMGFGESLASGILKVDTTSIGVTSWVRTKKVIDSLGALIGGSGTNIYNTDGSLTADRALSLNTHTLSFNGTGSNQFQFTPTGVTFNVFSSGSRDYTFTLGGGSIQLYHIPTGVGASSLLRLQTTYAELNAQHTSGPESYLRVYPDSIRLSASGGFISAPALASGVGTKALRYNLATGQITYADTTSGGGGGYTNLTQFVAQNNWKIFHSDGSGDVQELSLGAAGSPFYSVGTSSTPAFFAAVDYATSGTNVKITTQNTTDVGLEIKLASSQTANALNISSSSGTGDIVSVSSAGKTLINTSSDSDPIAGTSKFKVVEAGQILSFTDNGATGQGWLAVSNGTITGFVGHTHPTDGFVIGSFTGHDVTIRQSNVARFKIINSDATTRIDQKLYIGALATAPTAILHLKAGTATAGTAPLKLTSGTNLSTTEAGAIEYDGTHLYFTATNAGTRYQLDQQGGGSFNFARSLVTNTTDVGNVGVGEDDLMTYSVPAGTLGVNGDYIEFTMSFDLAANANTKQVKVKFGATTIYASGAQAQNDGVITITGQIIRTGAATQRITYSVTSNATLFPDYADYVTSAETLSGAVTLKATGEATSNDDIIQKINLVKFLPNN